MEIGTEFYQHLIHVQGLPDMAVHPRFKAPFNIFPKYIGGQIGRAHV
jgi:hypothetical protein